MRKFTILLFLIFGILGNNKELFSQNNYLIFKEDFNNNKLKWETSKSHKHITFVKDGYYYCNHNRRFGAWSSTKKIAINATQDFQIETSLIKLRGINNHGFGLIWGAKNSQNHHLFIISGEGKFQIGKAENGNYKPIIDWSESPNIKKWSAENILKIKKKGKILEFYINDGLVARTNFDDFFGDEIGFFINKNIAIKIDYLKIESSKKEFNSFPPDIFISNIKLDDYSKNSILEGGEIAEISFLIENKGKGKASDICLYLEDKNHRKYFKYPQKIKVGNLLSKEKKEVKFRVHASLFIPKKSHYLKVIVKESNGFDISPIKIYFEAEKQKKPNLKIHHIAINDEKSPSENGNSYGNGNSIIEAGESVEISLFVQNLGQGGATDIEAQILLESENLHLTFPEKDKIYTFEEIKAGDYKIVKFYFYTSRRYNQKNLPFHISLKSKETSLKKINLNLELGKRTENIVDVKIIPKKENNRQAFNKLDNVIEFSDVDKNFPTTKNNGKNTFAVIFGIENYKYAPMVEFAKHDAEIFYQYANKSLNIPEENIFYSVDNNATTGEFRKVFSKKGWLARRIEKGKSSVIIYYAGHGTVEVDSKKSYLIPYDIDPNYAETGFSLDNFYQSLSKIEAKDITIFIDACFSGLSRSQESLISGIRPVKIKPKKSEKIKPNMSVFTAATGSQYSSAFSEKSHGLFTYYLLKALQGDAKKSDNNLTIKELADYLKEKVSKQAGFLDREQTSCFYGNKNQRVFIKY